MQLSVKAVTSTVALAAAVMIMGSAPRALATTVPAQAFSCGKDVPTVKAGAPTSASLKIGVTGNDPTQMYTVGSKFVVTFTAVTKEWDVVQWQIADHAGTVHASGYIAAPAGTTTATVTCSSTIAGYFAASAHLQKENVTQGQVGSRPAGYTAFGVLPSVEDFVPEFGSTLDARRVGLIGANYVVSGTGLQPMNENIGSSWIVTSRSMTVTEPQHAGQYNPATQAIDNSIKLGTLAQVVAVDGLPYWASTAPSSTARGSYPPKSYTAYESYLAQVGTEISRVHNTYIPNQKKNPYLVTWEPDTGTPTQWMGTDAQFVELYQYAHAGIHSTDPDALVAGPVNTSLGLCASWLTRLAPLGFTKYIDAVACHGYYAIGSSSALPPEPAGLQGKLQTLRQTMASTMPAGTKLFITETGVSYPMGSHYSSTFPTNQVLEEHAEAVVRTHLIMLGEGVDTSFVFLSADYTTDVGFGMFFNLNLTTNAFSPNIEPKPAAMAVAAAARLVDGSRTLGALTNMASGQYGYSYLLADSAHVMTALWAHNSTFNASETYQLQVGTTGTSGTVLLFDTMGNPKSVSYSNGLLTVNVSEMPVYVLSSNVTVAKSHVRAPLGYDTSF